MSDLCQTAQPLYQSWAGMLHDVDVDAVHLVQFKRIDAAPVGALIHQGGIATKSRIFSQNDKLRVGGEDCFVCDLWITTTTRIAMEDIYAICVLQQFITKGTTAKDIGFSWRAIIYFEQHSRRGRACHCRLDSIDLLLQLVPK